VDVGINGQARSMSGVQELLTGFGIAFGKAGLDIGHADESI
jgi:hypothetical protein